MAINEKQQRFIAAARALGADKDKETAKAFAAKYQQNPERYDTAAQGVTYTRNVYGKASYGFTPEQHRQAAQQFHYYKARVEQGYDPIQIPSLDWNPTQYDDVTNEALAGWYKSNKSLPSAYQASEFSNYLAQYKQEREAAEIKDMYRLAGYDKAGTTRLKFNDAWKEYGIDYDLTDADEIRRKQIGVPPKAFLNLYTTDGDFADEDTRRFEAGELPVALDPVFQRPTPMPRATHGVSFDPRGVQQAQASAGFTGGQGVQQPAQAAQSRATLSVDDLKAEAQAEIAQLLAEREQKIAENEALRDRTGRGESEFTGYRDIEFADPTDSVQWLILNAPVSQENIAKGAQSRSNKYNRQLQLYINTVGSADAAADTLSFDPQTVGVSMITDAEADIINAYYGAGNSKAGDAVYDYYTEKHAREYAEREAADFAESASGASKVMAAVGSFMPSTQYAAQTAGNALVSAVTGNTEPARESAATLAMRRAGAGEASLLENTRGVGRWAAQVGLGTAKMLPMLATGVAAPALMGASAGGQAALDAKDSGATAGQQFFQGLAQGVAEGLFEKWSLGALKAFKPVKAAGVKGALRELAKLGFVNATEEVFTDVSNMLTDAVIMEAFGDGKSESEIRQLYEARINNGEPVDAARWGVVGDIATKLLNTAAVGAGMGVLLGGGKVLGEAASNIGTRAEQGAAAQEPPAPRQSVTDAPQAIAGQGRADTPAQQQNAVQGQETANTQYAQQDAQRREVAQMRSQAEAVIETLPAEQQDTAREVLTQWQNENNAARANPNVVMLESRDSIDTVTDSRMQSAERLGKALGVNVQWAESISRPNGQTAEALYDAATGTITIAVEADAPYHHLFGHEFTHHLEQSDGYDAMRGFVVQQLQQRGDYDAAMQVLSDTYQTNDTAVLERELVADYAKNVLFADEATVRYFVRSQSGLGGRILNWITDTLAKLGGQNSEAAAQLRQARDLWAAAMQGERGAGANAMQTPAQTVREAPSQPATQPLQEQRNRSVAFSESGALGNSGVAYTNNNQAIQFDYAVVPVSDLITSHDENGNANPAYPQELQPRQRDRTASLAQIRSIAATLNPERLGADSSVQNGAPIVGNDGVVESGNGRTAAIALAYRNGGERARRYAQYIRDNAVRFGIDPQSIPSNPVLVRMRTSDINRATFGDVANQSTTAAFSPLETAVKDATALTPDTMSLFVPNDTGRINTRDNQPFIQRFFRNAVNSSEIGEYVTANGELSQAGLTRIRNAIFQKAYDNVALGERLSELLDDNSKTLTNALVNAAPVMVDLNIGIEGGHYYPLNIVDDVTAAAAKFVSLREQNVPIDEYLSQLGFMPDLSPEARALLTVINDSVKRRSYKGISGYLTIAADAVKALGDPRQASFIDNSTVTKGDILSVAAQRYEAETGRPVSLSELEPRTGEVGAETARGVLRQAETGEAVESGQVGLDEGSQFSLRSDPLDAMLASYGLSGTTTARVLTKTTERTPPLSVRAAEFGRSMIRQFSDAGNEIVRIGRISKDSGLYQNYDWARRSRAIADNMIFEAQYDINGVPVGESLQKVFEPIKTRDEAYQSEAYSYLYHLHNIDRMTLEERGYGANKPVFGEHVTADMSRAEVQKAEAAHPEFKAFAAAVNKYNANLMRWRVDSGLVSKELAKELSRMYSNYVPTYRVLPKTGGVSARGTATTIDPGLRRAKGSNLDLVPIDVSMARQTLQTISAAKRNQFGLNLLANARKHARVLGDFVTVVGETTRRDALAAANALLDADPADPNAPNSWSGLNSLPNSFTLFENGEAVTIQVNRALAEGLHALEPASYDAVDRLANRAMRGFKALITNYSPLFTIRNVLRDQQDGLLFSESPKRFAKNLTTAMSELSRGSEDAKLYRAMGGYATTMFENTRGLFPEHGKLRNALEYLPKRIEALNILTEQATRFAEFKAVLQREGRTPEGIRKALYASAEVTVNFSRAGTTGRRLNSVLVPFFNPAMQGASKAFRSFSGQNGWKAAKNTAVRAALFGIAPAVLNHMLFGDDEDYAQLPDRIKWSSWVFKIAPQKFLVIPTGRVLSVFSAGAKAVLAMIDGESPDWSEYGAFVVSQSGPVNPLTSNIFSPMLAMGTNQTWYGSPIETAAMQNLPMHMRYDEKTDAISKWLGRWNMAQRVGLSPKKINYLLDAYTGVLGDLALPILAPYAERNGFIKAFVADTVLTNRAYEDFYNTIDDLTKARNEPDAPTSTAYILSYMNLQSKNVSELNKQARAVQNSTELTDAQKLEKVRELRALSNAIMSEALRSLPTYVEIATAHNPPDFGSGEGIERAKAKIDYDAFGAEYALRNYFSEDTFTSKVQQAKDRGLSYEKYYQAYFAIKDIKEQYANVYEKDKYGNNEKLITNNDDARKAAVMDYINKVFKNPKERELVIAIISGYSSASTASTSSAPRRVGFGDTQEDKPVRIGIK